MGLLNLGRAIGRAIGRGVETVGKIIHSEKTQEVGRKIQDACRETAVSTGRQREYDQDTATERETRQIADILSSFSLGLNSQAGSIEVMAQQTVKQYFDNLTAAIQGGEAGCTDGQRVQQNSEDAGRNKERKGNE